MKERTRELARKNADYWMNHYDRKSLADMQVLYKDVEKFALLIVRECVNQCEQNIVGMVGSHANAHNSAVQKCMNSITEHFGI